MLHRLVRREPIQMGDEEIPQIVHFNYLGSIIHQDVGSRKA